MEAITVLLQSLKKPVILSSILKNLLVIKCEANHNNTVTSSQLITAGISVQGYVIVKKILILGFFSGVTMFGSDISAADS